MKSKTEDILFKIGFEECIKTNNPNQIRGCCPIHGGTNGSEFVFNFAENTFVCYSKECHRSGNTLLDLVAKVLNVTREKATEFLKENNFSGQISVSPEIKRINYTRALKSLLQTKEEDGLPLSHMNQYKEDKYFKSIGFTKETLDYFFVKYCDQSSNPMYGRSFAPVLNGKKQIIGFTGRSIFEPCSLCLGRHNPKQDCVDNYVDSPKWKHFGIKSTTCLYNSWNIEDWSQKIVLVEGAKDVWWLHQNGIRSAVGIFGHRIYPYQVKILISRGVSDIIFCLDKDDEDDVVMKAQLQKLQQYFNIINVQKYIPVGKDIVDMNQEFLDKHIRSVI